PAPIPDASARAFFAAEASRVPLAAVAAGFAVRFEPGASDAEALRGTLIVESADGSALPPVEPDDFIPEAHLGFERVRLEAAAPGRLSREATRGPDRPEGTPVLPGVLRLGPAAAPVQRLAIEVPLEGAVGAAPGPVATPPARGETSV